jgi:CheY-like chemotaxis protein
MAAPRILLVEDEAIIAMAVAFALEAAGYAVTVASNGRDALGKLPAARPDAVVTDYMMPHMDGGEFIRRVRAMDGMGDIPIVIVTAIAEYNLRGKADGYSAYLSKPVNEEKLLALLAKLTRA